MPAFKPGGDYTERLENGLTARQNARLEEQATKRGWRNDGKRWDTDSTLEEIEAARAERPLTLKEKALRAVHYDVEHPDARVRGIARRNIETMEAQNLADEHLEVKNRRDYGGDEGELDSAIAGELAHMANAEEGSDAAPAPPAEQPERI